MPHLVFIILAIALAASAYFLSKDAKDQKIILAESVEQESYETENREPENVMNLISVEPMEIEIGYGLIPLADEATGGDLLQRIAFSKKAMCNRDGNCCYNL